eukprot:tig00021525_g22140.t1
MEAACFAAAAVPLRSGFVPATPTGSARRSWLGGVHGASAQAPERKRAGPRRVAFEAAPAPAVVAAEATRFREDQSVEEIAKEAVAERHEEEIGFFSRILGGLLSIKPVWQLAKLQARSTIKSRANSAGRNWEKEVAALRKHDWATEIKKLKLNSSLAYPDYFLRPFHSYDEGNMCWEAALEQELALVAIGVRDFPGSGPKGAKVLRESYHRLLKAAYGIPDPVGEQDAALDPLRGMAAGPLPSRVVDMGCGSGLSTIGAAELFPGAHVTGVELSPYFLAMANYNKDRLDPTVPRGQIEFLHANAEDTGLPAGQYDVVFVPFLCHELPREASINVFREARRLLKSGGILLFIDQNPEAYAQMSPAIFTMFKSTEPWMQDYLRWTGLHDGSEIERAGFTAPFQIRTCEKHYAMVARAL